MFYDGKTTIGSAQLVNNPSAGFTVGTATLKARLGVGSHTLKAVFGATNNNQTSTSSPQTVTVTGQMATSASISAAGTAGKLCSDRHCDNCRTSERDWNGILQRSDLRQCAGWQRLAASHRWHPRISGSCRAGATLACDHGCSRFQQRWDSRCCCKHFLMAPTPNAYISTYAIYLGERRRKLYGSAAYSLWDSRHLPDRRGRLQWGWKPGSCHWRQRWYTDLSREGGRDLLFGSTRRRWRHDCSRFQPEMDSSTY